MRSAKKWLERKKRDAKGRKKRLYFTGFSMGLADLVPGVSGGTIALLYGIYDELLYSIKLFSGQIPKLLISRQFKEALRTVPFGFLVPLGLGILTAVFGFVQIVTYLLDNHAVYVWSLFFGLVIGTVIIVSRRVSSWNINRYIFMLIGFLFTYGIVGLSALDAEPTPLVMFGTGMVAICAMVLPGISGSLIMVILGQYENVLDAVSSRNISQLVYFAVGAILGVALFARLLSWLLKNYHAAVIAFLTGMILGSLRKVWPWKVEHAHEVYTNILPDIDWSLAASVLLMIFGFILVLRLEKLGITREHVDIDDKEFKQEIIAQQD